MRPIDPDEFVDSLDFTDRERFCRSWGRLLIKGKVECVTDRLLHAAFSALEQFDAIQTLDFDSPTSGCMLGVFRAIRQGITERPSDAERSASRIADYCMSRNLAVAVAAIRQFEPLLVYEDEFQLGQFHYIAIPKLREAALRKGQSQPNSLMTVRALAFHVLYELDSSFLFCHELRDARFACAQTYFSWVAKSDWRAEEWLLRANTFIWYP